jgi:hypothetical protein
MMDDIELAQQTAIEHAELLQQENEDLAKLEAEIEAASDEVERKLDELDALEGRLESEEPVTKSLDDIFDSWAKNNEETPQRIQTKLHLHSDKDGMRECGEGLGLTGDALDGFTGVLYEATFDAIIDINTGETICIGLNGVPLSAPVAL